MVDSSHRRSRSCPHGRLERETVAGRLKTLRPGYVSDVERGLAVDERAIPRSCADAAELATQSDDVIRHRADGEPPLRPA